MVLRRRAAGRPRGAYLPAVRQRVQGLRVKRAVSEFPRLLDVVHFRVVPFRSRFHDLLRRHGQVVGAGCPILHWLACVRSSARRREVRSGADT